MISILFSTPTSRRSSNPKPDDGENMTAQDVLNHPAYREKGVTWLSFDRESVYVTFGPEDRSYTAIVPTQVMIDWQKSCPEIVVEHHTDSRLSDAAKKRQRDLNTFTTGVADEDGLTAKVIEQSMRRWRQRPSTEN